MELWDAYHANGTLAGFDLVRGEKIPQGVYHMVCEAVIQHTDGEYLLMQRSFEKEIYPGKWEIGAGGSALKGENKLQAILREVREETGIDEGDFKEIYSLVHEKHQSIYFGFLLTTSYPKSDIKLQDGETIDFRWVSKDELVDFYESGQCPDTLKRRLQEFMSLLM